MSALAAQSLNLFHLDFESKVEGDEIMSELSWYRSPVGIL